jgi:hypothetical protein
MPAAAPTAQRILALQQTAGNAAVSRALGARTLAREATYPDAHPKDDKAHWGEMGSGPDPRVLGAHVADDLLVDAKFNGAVQEVLGRAWIRLLVTTVEEIRERGKLKALIDAVPGGRVRAVADFVNDPITFDFEKSPLSPQEKALMMAKDPAGNSMRKDIEDQRMTLAMEQFAYDRRVLVNDVNTAKDADDRKAKLKAVNDHDAKRLPPLVALAKDRTGDDRWKHPDPKVVDAVLAAIQMQSVREAQISLDEDTAKVKSRNKGDIENWCGNFAEEKYIAMKMHDKFKGSFESTLKAMLFFTYKPEGIIGGLFPNVVKADDGTDMPLPQYHEIRKSTRRWYTTAQVMGGGDLDIRPGDIVCLSVAYGENVEKPEGDHVVMVESYDPKTRMLYTIGGNDAGYVVRKPGEAEPKDTGDDRRKREAAEAATGRLLGGSGGSHVAIGEQNLKQQPLPATSGPVKKTHVAGIGRPSLVDFEEHQYSYVAPKKK